MCNKVTGVGISRTTLTLEEAGTHRLTATIAPPKATNPNVTWSTSNASVATVDSGGNVIAKSAGTAKIRVTTKDGGFWQECTVTVLRVQISKTSLSLYEKENSKLTVTVTPSNTNNSISWSSSCKSVATVDSSGLVCAKSAGTSTIAVTCGGITKTCKLTVSKKVSKVTCVGLKPTSLSLKVGESDFLVAEVRPAGASNNNITWKSSCTDIATVSSAGRVYAIAPGTATITVKSGDGGTECTKTCKVTVTKNDSNTGGTNIPVTGVEIEEVGEVYSLVKMGENCTLKAVIYPKESSNREVIWKSANESIVKVNQSGLICPKKEGETWITVKLKDSEEGAVYPIKVLPAVPITGINVEKVNESSNTIQLKAVLNPPTATGAVNWYSSDDSIATVSSTGLVTRHKPGMVMITAMPVTTLLSIAGFLESIGKFFEDVFKWLGNLFSTIWDGIKSLWESIFGGGREDTETASPSATVVITETPGQTVRPGETNPPETEKPAKAYITLAQMKNLGWSKIHCGYKVIGTEKDSPIDDMTSEITRKHRDINQGDIDKINSLFEKYQINTKKRICAFFAECSAETSNGDRFLEAAGTKEQPFNDPATRTNLNKWFDTYKKYGSKYRGGGAIQLTWNYHYVEFDEWMKKEFEVSDPNIVYKGAEYVAMNYPWEAAVFFWSKSNLNNIADSGDISKVTAVVNKNMSNEEYAKRETAYKNWTEKYVFPF